jgi:endonuclease YncB( thermonuclease family)
MQEADKVRTAAAPSAAVTPAPAEEEVMRGVPDVVDTGTLRIGGREVRLAGIIGMPGEFVSAMVQWIDGREAVCEARESETWQCRIGGRDLSELVLSNGGGRAATDASAELRRAERAARNARLGIWGG